MYGWMNECVSGGMNDRMSVCTVCLDECLYALVSGGMNVSLSVCMVVSML
jgi:hypothetical protein